jgi:uncharacterized protein
MAARPPAEVEALREKLGPYFASRPEILSALVFGSRARDAAGPLSDVDIAVLLDPRSAGEWRIDDYKALRLVELMSILETAELDLVILNESPPLLAHRVIRDGIVVHCVDEAALTDFRFRALQTYLDTKPIREAQAAALHERLERGEFARTGR